MVTGIPASRVVDGFVVIVATSVADTLAAVEELKGTFYEY